LYLLQKQPTRKRARCCCTGSGSQYLGVAVDDDFLSSVGSRGAEVHVRCGSVWVGGVGVEDRVGGRQQVCRWRTIVRAAWLLSSLTDGCEQGGVETVHNREREQCTRGWMSALEGGDGEQSRALTLCGRHGGGMKKWLMNQPYCTISLISTMRVSKTRFCWSATPLHVWGTWPPQCLHPHPMHCGIDGHEVVLPSRFVFSLCCCCHGLLQHWQQCMRNIPLWRLHSMPPRSAVHVCV
jgi:hypothetical protein